MKIIQILPELNSGGVERGTLEVAQFLVDQGCQSLVISNGGRLVPQLTAAGSRHLTLPVHRKRPSSLFQVKALRHLLETEKPDLIHLRSRVPAWLTWLAWRKMNPATRPCLVTTVHGFYSVNRYSQIMTTGEKVICVSESTRQYVRQNYPHVDPTKLIVIPRGVDPADFPHRFQPPPAWLASWHQEFPETQGKTLITLPGRITRLKGHTHFFRLIAHLIQQGKPIHGIIAGGADPRKSSYLTEIQNEAAQLKLTPHLTFTGHRSDLREILAHSDFVCSLTTQPESFGRTTLEALALGTPVVGFDHGGVGEILDALLPSGKIPLGDESALAQKILTWLENPPEVVPTHPFTLDAMLRRTFAVYQDLLKNRPNPT